jgi:hypothetical protein
LQNLSLSLCALDASSTLLSSKTPTSIVKPQNHFSLSLSLSLSLGETLKLFLLTSVDFLFLNSRGLEIPARTSEEKHRGEKNTHTHKHKTKASQLFEKLG